MRFLRFQFFFELDSLFISFCSLLITLFASDELKVRNGIKSLRS